MDKSYTAQEMREEARIFEARGGSSNIAAMLHQAADEIEREERCEWCGTVKELDALVAKAREVVK